MPRPKNPKAGRGPCPCCKQPVLFRLSPATSRLSYTCDHCDHSAYADAGGLAQRTWLASIPKDPAETPSPAPAANDPAPPKPAAKRGGFSLSDL